MNSRLFLIFSMLVILSSCAEQKNKEQQKLLVGKWNVYASEMNQKSNELMQNAFFEFQDDNSVQSNLFDGNILHKYSVDMDRLMIDTNEDFDLKISKLNSDTLILEGKMKMFYMKFYLNKMK